MKPCLLLAIAILGLPIYASAEEASELCVKQNDKTLLTLRIAPRSLAFLAEHPSQLTTILRERGIDCCSPQTRISEGVWECCHGKFVISSTSPSLQDVLVAAFNGPKVTER